VSELQISVVQITAPPGSSQAQSFATALIENIRTIINEDPQPTTILPDTSWVDAGLRNTNQNLQNNKSDIQTNVTSYIEANYAYDPAKCKRDIGFIIDAVCYDMTYEGNSQTADAADEYYSGGIFQIGERERQATVDTFDYIKALAGDCIVNTTISALNGIEAQDTSLPPATQDEVTVSDALFDIVVNLVANGYSSTVTIEETVLSTVLDNTTVTFHQYSLITASGHTFEWVGAGTNVNTALPYLGGTPILENYVIQTNGGRVYYTGTDQRGDFRIGGDLTINRNTGTITGRTFSKSLFAVLTPYILAIS
jgi:hypothetical protein